MSRMFPFITGTKNPTAFKCPHECSYCWSQAENGIVDRFSMKLYQRQPSIDLLAEVNERMPIHAGEFIFLCDMLDLFAEVVPEEIIRKVLEIPKNNLESQFLLLTKNPKRYLALWDILRDLDNCVLGCTIESNRNYPNISKAPSQFERLYWLSKVDKALYEKYKAGYKRRSVFVSIEPIMNFDLQTFENNLHCLEPSAVAVGYDNYNHHLPEPPLEKTMQLISKLEQDGITVHRKTLREAWK